MRFMEVTAENGTAKKKAKATKRIFIKTKGKTKQMKNAQKYQYEDKLTGKVWRNEDKAPGSTGQPDYKGQLCSVADVAKVTSGEGRDKRIDWAKIPGERKMSISIWDNDGTLNVKIAARTVKEDLPF